MQLKKEIFARVFNGDINFLAKQVGARLYERHFDELANKIAEKIKVNLLASESKLIEEIRAQLIKELDLTALKLDIREIIKAEIGWAQKIYEQQDNKTRYL